VRDLIAGPASSSFSFVAATDGLAFFAAGDGVAPEELWVTDGTEAGTRPIMDITRGQRVSGIGPSSLLDDTLFFSRETSELGAELWKTDGTDAGTTLVKDINPGTDGSAPLDFMRAGDLLYFTALEPSTGYQLWKSDGSEAGTQRLTNFPRPRYYRGRPLVPILVDGDRLLFGDCINCGFPFGAGLTAPADLPTARETIVDGGRGEGEFTRYVQIWETDGTERGTRRVSDAFLGALQPEGLLRSGRFAYFRNPSEPQIPGVTDPGVELWALPLDGLGRCGNGALDAGEECDSAGESAECDVDCTAPACGDRMLNTTVGEECDDGNSDDEDCCTDACRANAGTPCSDLSLCTDADVCNETGQCVSGPTVDCVALGGFGLCSASSGCLLPRASPTATPTITPTAIFTATPSPTPPLCTGDCDASGRVAVNELVTLVSIALDKTQLSACPRGVPIGVRVDIALLVQAVNSALAGCGRTP
jgi:ELWxxDGT repeat protein